MHNQLQNIKVIGFDADDTLWFNAGYFREVEQLFANRIADYITDVDPLRELYSTEMSNMEWYGYGAMPFTLSVLETAVRISKGSVPASVLDELLQAGKAILNKPIELLSGVQDILPALSGHYRLLVVTKGDLLDQERKLKRSGLLPFFQHVEVVSEKHAENYQQLVDFMNIRPDEFLMVGNSLRSDIHPVLEIGSHAVYVPCEIEWQFEQPLEQISGYFTISSLKELPLLLF